MPEDLGTYGAADCGVEHTVGIHDAAYVDGAGAWKTFWHITMPLLSPILMLVITMLLIQGLQVYVGCVLPKCGRTGLSTTVLSIWLYTEAFTTGVSALCHYCYLAVYHRILSDSHEPPARHLWIWPD